MTEVEIRDETKQKRQTNHLSKSLLVYIYCVQHFSCLLAVLECIILIFSSFGAVGAEVYFGALGKDTLLP